MYSKKERNEIFMFVYNFKINGSKVFRVFFTVVILLIICIMGVVLFRIFTGANNSSSCLPQSDVSEISAKNYTNVLKTVHENIDNYVGMKIKFTGYVYRVSDLNENQFVLARDMIISSDSQFLVVGFLSEYVPKVIYEGLMGTEEDSTYKIKIPDIPNLNSSNINNMLLDIAREAIIHRNL